MQIILGALCAGVLTLAVVVVVLRNTGQQPAPPDLPILSYFGAAFALATLGVSAFLPRATLKNWRRGVALSIARNPDQEALALEELPVAGLGIYQTTMILSAAPLEGAAFLN